MNIPNIITVVRLIIVPFIVYLLFLSMAWAIWTALMLFILGMLSDIVDGVIARKDKLVTNFGIFLDPVADKILVLSMFLMLGYLNAFSIWIPFIILWRELLVSGVRNVASSHGQIIGANWMGKTKSVFQTTTITAGLVYLAIQAEQWFSVEQLNVGHMIVTTLGLVAVVLSVIFAGIFIYWNRTLLFKDI